MPRRLVKRRVKKNPSGLGFIGPLLGAAAALTPTILGYIQAKEDKKDEKRELKRQQAEQQAAAAEVRAAQQAAVTAAQTAQAAQNTAAEAQTQSRAQQALAVAQQALAAYQQTTAPVVQQAPAQSVPRWILPAALVGGGLLVYLVFFRAKAA